ncbi:hypothetical protein [Galactobacter sp.]|uniref:hypothetical protein n=1 Tax=Galactobacter sp. TaxID=2676125 RepID=UPI0025BC9994|nr:hypothetical protein [Galactobacter sp.]
MAQWVRQWESQTWVDQVDAWVSHVLTTYGVERTGGLTLHSRGLSSVVFTAATQAGSVYLKVPAPIRATEADLVSLIAPHAQGHVVEPLAVEPEEGWILSPGTGQSLADLTHTARRRGDTSPTLTPRVMTGATETQLALSGIADELTGAGLLAGLLPGDMEFHLAEAVERHSSLPAEHPLALMGADAQQLMKRVPQASESGARLASAGIPETLVPSALSLSDVLIPRSRRSPVAFLGWGMARWSHPFSWVAPLFNELSVRSTEVELAAAMEAYVAGFASYGNADQLAGLFGPAESLAALQQHQDLMDLLLAAEPEDQVAAAPQAFMLLRDALRMPTQAPKRRH